MFPFPSLAVNTTVVVPTPVTVVPEAGDCVTVGVPQLSEVAVALYAGKVAVQAAPKVNDCVAGQVTVGGVLSTLFTLNEQDVVFPFPSLAVKTTVVVPTPETVVPEAGDCVTLGVPQLSAVAVAL